MPLGIIYLAKNTISNKCYVGQSIRTLEVRKKEHFSNTVKKEYKFARALRKYPVDSWEWSVLAEVELNDLDEYEKFFITDLDSFKNGYNTVPGGNFSDDGNPRRNSKVYELWHPEHGEIRETLGQLYNRAKSFGRIQELIKGSRRHIAGYVLLENKEKYDDFFPKKHNFYHPNHGIINCTVLELYKDYKQYFNEKYQLYILTRKKIKTYGGWVLAEDKDDYVYVRDLHEFYHPDHGVISCTCKELFRSFPQYFGTKDCHVYDLANRRFKIHHGWCLAENKDSYDQINKFGKISLAHFKYGIKTLTREEFKNQYGLRGSSISHLLAGRIKSTLGWTLTKINPEKVYHPDDCQDYSIGENND